MNVRASVLALALLASCAPRPALAPTAESVLVRLNATVVCGSTLNATAIIEGDAWRAPVHAQLLVTPPANLRLVVLRSADGPGSTLTVTADKLTPGDTALTTFQSESIIGLFLGRPVVIPHTARQASLVVHDEGHVTIVVTGESMRQEIDVEPFEDTLIATSARVWEGEALLYEAHFSDPKVPEGCNDPVSRTLEIIIPKEVKVQLRYVQVRWMRE
jgi:hypothetical protein